MWPLEWRPGRGSGLGRSTRVGALLHRGMEARRAGGGWGSRNLPGEEGEEREEGAQINQIHDFPTIAESRDKNSKVRPQLSF